MILSTLFSQAGILVSSPLPELDITAIVTVADDGGSSGRLRQEFDMLPPGDIRNCLVALADTEPLMQRLFGDEMEYHEPIAVLRAQQAKAKAEELLAQWEAGDATD